MIRNEGSCTPVSVPVEVIAPVVPSYDAKPIPVPPPADDVYVPRYRVPTDRQAAAAGVIPTAALPTAAAASPRKRRRLVPMNILRGV
jgi:hypothetical protein